MRATCPDCGADGHLSAFLVEAEGKRLGALLAAMPPDLGRAVIGYLGLFKPSKASLRLPRAVKLVEELRNLVDLSTVTNDDRGGVRRPATPSTWAAGIEQLLVQRASLTLPLKNHHYLRAVVFGLADQADAAIERQKEADARVGRSRSVGSEKPAGETPLANALAYIEQQLGYGAMTPDEAVAARADARLKHGAAQ